MLSHLKMGCMVEGWAWFSRRCRGFLGPIRNVCFVATLEFAKHDYGQGDMSVWQQKLVSQLGGCGKCITWQLSDTPITYRAKSVGRRITYLELCAPCKIDPILLHAKLSRTKTTTTSMSNADKHVELWPTSPTTIKPATQKPHATSKQENCGRPTQSCSWQDFFGETSCFPEQGGAWQVLPYDECLAGCPPCAVTAQPL